MPEKLRPAQKENVFSKVKVPSYAGPVLFLTIALITGIFFYFKKHTVSQEVKEENSIDKTLSAVICQTEKCFWLNKEGVSFNEGAKVSGNMVTVVEDKTNKELKVGDKLIDPKTLGKINFLKEELATKFEIKLLDIKTEDSNYSDFDFTTSEGWVLRLNLSENIYKTLETLKQSLVEIKKSGPTALLDYLDLRIQNKVYYKFK
ncbi:MAG: hypothetical protein Q8Q90_03310 [bacterium]|nr:hypothetical protein [bacterium]